MLKGGLNTGALAQHGIRISQSVYGTTVKLASGLVMLAPELIWYNDWKSSGSPSNPALESVINSNSNKKKGGGKKGGPTYYSAAIDMLLGLAPIGGVLTCWYNNQPFRCVITSASGFVSGGAFTFTPVSGGESRVEYDATVPGGLVVTVPNFVADGQTTTNDSGVFDVTIGRWLESADPSLPPGPGQYTVDNTGDYTFNAAQMGNSVKIFYYKYGVGGGKSAILAGIVSVVIDEGINPITFDDYGSCEGSATLQGHWKRPLWNKAFPIPGLPYSQVAYSARDPYSWFWDGTNPTVHTGVPDGTPIIVYYSVPIILKSNGSFYSSQITPLALLNMEFEAACGSGSEYVNHPDQRDVNKWCAGVGSVRFDLGTSNAVPNLQMEVIGAGTQWPNGDCDVADLITDIVMSGPIVLPDLDIPHGANCNDYSNGGPFNPQFPAGCGVLLGPISGLSPAVPPVVPEGLVDLYNWCRANGISAALSQDSQRSCKDLLDELATIGNSAPVYSGDTLRFIPYDEVSGAGYGAIYVSPTAAGPIADLGDQDFVKTGDERDDTPIIAVTRKRRTDCDNVVSLEYNDRSIDYNQSPVTDVDQMAVALYGPRKGGELSAASLATENPPSGSKLMKCLYSSAAAQAIASILVKRSAAGVDVYDFELKAEYYWLEAMDLVTVPFSGSKVPVRLINVQETKNRTYKCTAQQFVYGLNHPYIKDVAAMSGTTVISGDPGFVNPPVIFQPTSAMSDDQEAIWFAVSGADPNYGGCVAYVSIDGGASYNPIGAISPGTTGYLTADFPAPLPEQDPDVTDTLAVDLTESAGAMSSQSQQTADANLDQCYLAIGSGSPLTATDFESVCYTDISVTSPYNYSGDTYIRRACKGSTYADHPVGSRFAVLNGSVFKMALDPYWIGKVLMFKFAAVNKLGGQQNNLADCVVYTFTPTLWASEGPADFLLINGN